MEKWRFLGHAWLWWPKISEISNWNPHGNSWFIANSGKNTRFSISAFYNTFQVSLSLIFSKCQDNGFDELHAFLISNTFISNARLKLVKNYAKAKQHPEAELLIFENCSYFSSENNWTYSEKYTREQMCLYSWDRTINHNENEDENEKNKSHRYDINRPRSSHGHKYSKYKKRLTMIMFICIKQHISNEAEFMEKLTNTEAELKKTLLIKKNVYFKRNAYWRHSCVFISMVLIWY